MHSEMQGSRAAKTAATESPALRAARDQLDSACGALLSLRAVTGPQRMRAATLSRREIEKVSAAIEVLENYSQRLGAACERLSEYERRVAK